MVYSTCLIHWNAQIIIGLTTQIDYKTKNNNNGETKQANKQIPTTLYHPCESCTYQTRRQSLTLPHLKTPTPYTHIHSNSVQAFAPLIRASTIKHAVTFTPLKIKSCSIKTQTRFQHKTQKTCQIFLATHVIYTFTSASLSCTLNQHHHTHIDIPKITLPSRSHNPN